MQVCRLSSSGVTFSRCLLKILKIYKLLLGSDRQVNKINMNFHIKVALSRFGDLFKY